MVPPRLWTTTQNVFSIWDFYLFFWIPKNEKFGRNPFTANLSQFDQQANKLWLIGPKKHHQLSQLVNQSPANRNEKSASAKRKIFCVLPSPENKTFQIRVNHLVNGSPLVPVKSTNAKRTISDHTDQTRPELRLFVCLLPHLMFLPFSIIHQWNRNWTHHKCLIRS